MRARLLMALGAAAVAAVIVLVFFYAQAPPATPVIAGDAAPDFTLPAVGGDGQATLSSLLRFPVLLVFFDTRWPATSNELAAIERVHRRYLQRGLRVLGVVLDDGEPPPSYFRDLAVTFTLVRDRGGRVTAADWGRATARQAYLIAPGGQVKAVFQGPVSWLSERTRARIEEILPSSAAPP